MRQAAFFMEYGPYQGFKASPENEAEHQMYFLIIKENEVVKLCIGVSTAITLNDRVSGVSEDYVYDWLWNQGLSFLHDHETDFETLLDTYNIDYITLMIDENIVKGGDFTAPWEELIVKNTIIK